MRDKIKNNARTSALKGIAGFAVILFTGFLGGCTLANPDAGAKESEDRLIGAFITSEYLDLYDMDRYLNDHASQVINGDSITVGRGSKYEGKLVATVDKEAGESASQWKISFGDTEGEYILLPLTRDEEGNETAENICSAGISAPYLNYSVADGGDSREISGTVYEIADGKGDSTYYVNPVYQSENGEIYALTGNGYSNGSSDSEENTMSATLTAENTFTENGKSRKEVDKVTVQFAFMYRPVDTIVYQMNAANQILKKVIYDPTSVPDTIKPENGAAYILVETRKKDPSGKLVSSRTLLDLKEEEDQYLEIWYPLENGLISRKDVKVQ